jgi:ComF family protein
MAARLSRMIGIVKAVLFPARCLGCDAICPWPAPSDDGATLAGYVCAQCDAQLAPIGSPLCLSCGSPFATDQGVDHLCDTCRQRPFAFQGARAAGLYADALRAVIHQYKYRGCEPLAGPLGHMLWQAFWRHWTLDDVDAIVPVPLHRRRMRKRGFNQARLLLRDWPRLAADQGVAFDGRGILNDALVRRRYTAPQTGLGRKARQANMRNAFGLGKDSVNGMRVLLVDDVFTTGATAHACARVLIRAGAASVKVLTLARAAQ